MAIHQPIFAKKYISSKLNAYDIGRVKDLASKKEIISRWIESIEKGIVNASKETSLQADFLNDIFGTVLGYEYHRETGSFNLEKETKSITDGTFADGALGFFEYQNGKINYDVRAVIELKDAQTQLDAKQHYKSGTQDTPVAQAFSYASKAGGKCRWVIVSNFLEICLYHHSDQSRFELFTLKELLQPDNLKRLFFLLQKENLIAKDGKSFIDSFYEKRQAEEQEITKKFYAEYKSVRAELFNHLKEHNPDKEELLLFTKSQKLLDRIVFVCFCEDVNLLPNYIFRQIIKAVKSSFDISDTRIWNQIKGLFHSIDKGNPDRNINKYDGGLFAEDSELDSLVIKDGILEKVIELSEYDFASDLNVNILGHIFEQSISDIEEIKADIIGQSFDKSKGKRKKEGVYYTPEYITRYIVKEAVGGWLEDRKKELGFYELPELSEEDKASIKLSKSNKLTYNGNVKRHIGFWNAYKEKLAGIKVLDPACGSGAFLIQVFDYLYSEGQSVNKNLSELMLGQTTLEDLNETILKNNIYGVDINDESVEITKLSLWLKTARKDKELTDLDDNIKCGNSLIDDPEVAGDKAFNWFLEFPSVFPGYRDYSKKHSAPEYRHLTIEEIRERNIQEPEISYSAVPENFNKREIHDPSYSYKPHSKGFQKYGFDVIVGNPPYVMFSPDYFKCYNFTKGNNNTYVAFIEKILSLIKVNYSYIGYIIPNTWFAGDNYLTFRSHLLSNTNLSQIIQLPYDIFQAYIDTSIVIIKNNIFSGISMTYQFDIHADKGYIDVKKFNLFKQKIWLNFGKIFLNPYLLKIGDKVWHSDKNALLGNIASVNRGTLPPKDFELSKEKNRKYNIKWFNKQVFRYIIDDLDNVDVYVSYSELRENKPIELFSKEKILARQLMSRQFRMNLTYLNEEFAFKKNLYAIYEISNNFFIKYILCVLNSKLFSFCQVNFNLSLQRDDFPAFSLQDFKNFPIPNISLDNQRPFIEKADIMLDKNKELQEVRKAFLDYFCGQYAIEKPSAKLQNWHELSFDGFLTELKKKRVKLSSTDKFDLKPLFDREKAKAEEISNIISATDAEIDRMVYNLYGLTEEEIKIVEGE